MLSQGYQLVYHLTNNDMAMHSKICMYMNKSIQVSPAPSSFVPFETPPLNPLWSLQHRFEILRNVERGAGLGLDLVHRHSVGNLNQRKAVGKIHVKDTL